MFEKLALAAINSDRAANGWRPLTSRDDVPNSDGYPRMVKAVLEALRDGVTEEMIEAGTLANWGDRAITFYRSDTMKAIFVAMINAALEES